MARDDCEPDSGVERHSRYELQWSFDDIWERGSACCWAVQRVVCGGGAVVQWIRRCLYAIDRRRVYESDRTGSNTVDGDQLCGLLWRERLMYSSAEFWRRPANR